MYKQILISLHLNPAHQYTTQYLHEQLDYARILYSKGLYRQSLKIQEKSIATIIQEKALRNFKDNTIKILVATDIAARVLDIPLLPHVINFELPNVPEDYVHRNGRTGRAGAAREAISLVCSEEIEYQNEIEKLF